MTATETLPRETPRRQIDVALRGIGTAVPPSVPQDQVTALAEKFACHTDQQRAWLRRVFLRCGVETRGSVLVHEGHSPMDDLRTFYPAGTDEHNLGPGTSARMDRYAREAPVLAAAAAKNALADALIPAHAITHLITVSCTGFMAPGLDAELIQRLALRPDVVRSHIGFMGCHAAFNALAAARAAVHADPHALVLVCCVELCSLHFAYGWDPQKLVANALFGDGAAAAVVGGAGSSAIDPGTAPWRLRQFASLLLPNTRDAMTWRIGNHGFEMTLSPDLPAMVHKELRPWCEEWLGKYGLAIADVQSWAIHPGGPRILTAAAESLGLADGDLRFSRKVLAQHGNMSSTTILFVLQYMAAQGAPSPCVALGFGPGLMMEAILLDRPN